MTTQNSVSCSNCDTDAGADARFCVECGTPLAHGPETGEQTGVDGTAAAPALGKPRGMSRPRQAAPDPETEVLDSTDGAGPSRQDQPTVFGPPPPADPAAGWPVGYPGAPAPAAAGQWPQGALPGYGGYGQPPVYPPGTPAVYPPGPQQPQRSGTGAIIAATVLGILALAAIAIAVVVATSSNSSDKGPQLITTTPTTPVAAVAGASTPSLPPVAPAPVSSGPTVVHHKHHVVHHHHTAHHVTPVPHLSAPTSSLADRTEARLAVERHWSLIRDGAYSSAYALLSPTLQSGEAGWIQAHQEDALTNESIQLGAPTLTSSTTATVPVINLHTIASSGCFNWSGSYGMEKVGGAWKINSANISKSPC